MSEYTQSQYQVEQANMASGVKMIKDWRMKEDNEECGIDIVREFMDAERAQYGWPGPSVTKLKRRSRTPNHEDSRRSSTDEDEVSWRRQAEQDESLDKKTPCKFFLSASGCRFGSDCQFEHTDTIPEEQAVYQVPICPFFVTGFCRYGDQCHYAHVYPEELAFGVQEWGQVEPEIEEGTSWEETELADTSSPGFSSQTESTSEDENNQE